MTFKEKLQTELPNEICKGVPSACPTTYGYEKYGDRPCKGNGLIDYVFCEGCWNREMPNTETKEEKTLKLHKEDFIQIGYNQGMTDAWELAKKCVDLEGRGEDNELMFKIFNTVFLKQLFNDNTPQEALAKLKAYEDSKIEVGDVVQFKEQRGIVIEVDMFLIGLREDGVMFSWCKKDCKKTGKHIDIKSFLEQIGE